MDEYSFHPVSAIFPLMDGDALDSLAADIRENGLHEDIVLYDGQVLDGRNRLTACRLAGVKPRFSDFKGTPLEAVKFSWSRNRERRHLDSGQAAVADAKRAKMVEEYGKEVERQKKEAAKRKSQAKGKPRGSKQDDSGGKNSTTDDGKVRTQRAKSAGTNPRYIDDADKLVESYPELADKVESGKLSLPEAMGFYKRLESLPEKDRSRAMAMATQPGVPTKEALTMLNTVAELKPAAREALLSDFESGDQKKRSDAICSAAEKPPMPDARIAINAAILKQIERGQKAGNAKEYATAAKAIESLQSRLNKECEDAAKALGRKRNGR